MTPQEIVNGFNKLSGHEERGFSDLEFALACIRDDMTMASTELAFADNGEDGNIASQWAMFHAGCEFFNQVANCFINNEEPDYKQIYNEVVKQLKFSIVYESKKEEKNG